MSVINQDFNGSKLEVRRNAGAPSFDIDYTKGNRVFPSLV